MQYTKRAPLVNSSDVGPMTRLSVDTWDHRDVRTVTWNHGYDGLWSESHVSFVAITVRCLPVHLSHRCLPVHLSHRCLPIHISHRKRPHLLNTHRLPSVQRHFEHRVQRWHHLHHHYNGKHRHQHHQQRHHLLVSVRYVSSELIGNVATKHIPSPTQRRRSHPTPYHTHRQLVTC